MDNVALTAPSGSLANILTSVLAPAVAEAHWLAQHAQDLRRHGEWNPSRSIAALSTRLSALCSIADEVPHAAKARPVFSAALEVLDDPSRAVTLLRAALHDAEIAARALIASESTAGPIRMDLGIYLLSEVHRLRREIEERGF